MFGYFSLTNRCFQLDCVKVKLRKVSGGPLKNQPQEACILVAIDHFSKFCWLRALTSANSDEVIPERASIMQNMSFHNHVFRMYEAFPDCTSRPIVRRLFIMSFKYLQILAVLLFSIPTTAESSRML